MKERNQQQRTKIYRGLIYTFLFLILFGVIWLVIEMGLVIERVR